VAGGSPLTAGVAGTVLALLRRLGGHGRPAGAATPSRLTLTEREQEVLRGLVQGLAYKQVAEHLGVSIDTVRAHVRTVYRKLQVHSVAEAVSRAIREGLV
jgi:DNA-binding NarL/FixJ family response regulator